MTPSKLKRFRKAYNFTNKTRTQLARLEREIDSESFGKNRPEKLRALKSQHKAWTKINQQAYKKEQSLKETNFVNTLKAIVAQRKQLDPRVKVGVKIHAGLGAKGGAGFKGTVTKVDDHNVYFKNDEGRTFRAPHKLVSVAEGFKGNRNNMGKKIKLKDADLRDKTVPGSKPHIEQKKAAAEDKLRKSGPFAVGWDGQALEWYGDVEPDHIDAHNRGRYKPKGNAGDITHINVPDYETAQKIAKHHDDNNHKLARGKMGKDWYVAHYYGSYIKPMKDLDEYDKEMMKYSKPKDMKHAKLKEELAQDLPALRKYLLWRQEVQKKVIDEEDKKPEEKEDKKKETKPKEVNFWAKHRIKDYLKKDGYVKEDYIPNLKKHLWHDWQNDPFVPPSDVDHHSKLEGEEKADFEKWHSDVQKYAKRFKIKDPRKAINNYTDSISRSLKKYRWTT